jgi:hypothetical protein
MEYEKTELFQLGTSGTDWGEDFVQSLIADDPSLLGLGDLVVKDKERPQPGAGRLDFLLQDSPVTVRYEVEVQLGNTNPSHIIRTIEYWDRERRNSPQYYHIAVIVAEGITARFFNVISLFNQHIPLIAIKMSAISLGGKRSVIFTKVLDHSKKKFEEDEEAGVPETNRAYWEERTSQASMKLVDEVIAIAKKIDPAIGPRFNKGGIPLKKGTEFWNLLILWPRKKLVKMVLPCSQSEQIEAQLTKADIDFEGYNQSRNWYILTLVPGDLPKNSELLEKLISITYKKTAEEGAEGGGD